MMNQEIKQKWVAALHSGEYRQIRGKLRNAGKGRCCLGVLVDVCGAKWKQEDGDFVVRTGAVRRDEFSSMSIFYGRGSGLTWDEAERLGDMNDGVMGFKKHSFKAIADYIEEHL